MIQDGAITQTPFESSGKTDGDLSAHSIKQRVKKSIYTDLVPRAWRLSNISLRPFVLHSKISCSEGEDAIPNVEVLSGRTYCVDDSLYVLTSSPEPSKNCGYQGDIYSCLEDYKDLPGAGALDGSAWGVLTVEDIVVGSVRTWKMHGEKKLGKIRMDDPAVVEELDALADPLVEEPWDTFVDPILAEDVRAAGVRDIAVGGLK